MSCHFCEHDGTIEAYGSETRYGVTVLTHYDLNIRTDLRKPCLFIEDYKEPFGAAVVGINYCPICGQNLRERGEG